MIKFKRFALMFIQIALVFSVFFSAYAIQSPEYIDVNLPGVESPLTISVIEPGAPTDKEGRLASPQRLYSYRFMYNDNIFTFNIPDYVVEDLDDGELKRMLIVLIEAYEKTFDTFLKVLDRKPSGYKFNMTFGPTAGGYPFNWMNLTDKVSNIYPNCVPYANGREVFSKLEEDIISHEIGHGIFNITGTNFRTPGNKAIEEGFIDLFIGVDFSENTRIAISEDKVDSIKGLTQPDVDISIWGEEAVLAQTDPFDHDIGLRGYVGMTHHAFGKQFLLAYIDAFGEDSLQDFLVKLKASEDEPYYDDYGTENVKRILLSMGYTNEEIEKFETDLHDRIKRNIFVLTK